MLKSFKPVIFLSPWQWLTKNDSFEQEWAIGTGRLPYKTNEVRFNVDIPESNIKSLMSWNQAKFMVPEVADILSTYGDPENWFVYNGIIYPKWLSNLTRNEKFK